MGRTIPPNAEYLYTAVIHQISSHPSTGRRVGPYANAGTAQEQITRAVKRSRRYAADGQETVTGHVERTALQWERMHPAYWYSATPAVTSASTNSGR